MLSTEFTDAGSSTHYITTTQSAVTSQPTDGTSTTDVSGKTEVITEQTDGTSTTEQTATTQLTTGQTDSISTTEQTATSQFTTELPDGTSTTEQSGTTELTSGLTQDTYTTDARTSNDNITTTESSGTSNPTNGMFTTDFPGTTESTTSQTNATSTTDHTVTTQLTTGQTVGISTPGTSEVTPVQSTTPSINPPTHPTTAPTKPTTNPPTLPSTDPPVSTSEPLQCQNGGTFNGYNCTCPVGLNGTVCQFVEIDVEPVTIIRMVVVNLMINQEYNVKYDDETSREYKEFVRNFTNQMEKYYLAKKIANFKEVVVKSVSRGAALIRVSRETVDETRLLDEAMAVNRITSRAESVNVSHDVVLGIPNTADAEQLYQEDVGAITGAVDGLDSCTGECPDFNTTARPTVTETEADFGWVCEQFVKDPDIFKYYQPLSIDGKITCVTVCHSQHTDHKRCYNRGICYVFKTAGPICECHNVEETWYLNDDCSLPIHRTAFYAGLSVTLACLLVVVGVLSAFLLRNKLRQKRRSRVFRDQLVNEWINEEFEWSRSNSDIDNAGDVNNLAYAHEESAIHRDEVESYRQSVPVYTHTEPSLDTDNTQWSSSATIHGLDTDYYLPDTPNQHSTPTTNTLSFSNDGHPQSAGLSQPHRDASSIQPTRTNRPQIWTSLDL